MTDAPFAETHRATLLDLRQWVHSDSREAIDAALKEIERLNQSLKAADAATSGWETNYHRLRQEQRADVERWNTANAEANAEIDRLKSAAVEREKYITDELLPMRRDLDAALAEIDRLQKVIDAYERLAAKRLRETP